ncbi:MAG TPA: hypothetical protein VMU67_13100 [Steroidobacteraceae bacterium]|nr:hypothetical protein [Steroidobacteraceae bacterium]
MRSSRRCTWVAPLALCVGVACARAAEPCGAAGWNLSHEQALFAGAAISVRAGARLASAPTLATERLYRLTLTAQQEVTFAHTPGKVALTDGAYAGVARIDIPSTGTYRVAIDRPFWIDIVDRGKLINSTDFTGERGCAPHKIVAYALAAGTLVLQVSGQVSPRVEISITRAPDSASAH